MGEFLKLLYLVGNSCIWEKGLLYQEELGSAGGGGGEETMQSLNQLLVTPTVWVPFFNAAVFLDKSEAMYGMGAQTRPLYNYQL